MKPTAMTLFLVGALAALPGATAHGQAASCAGADDPVTAQTVEQAQDATRCLINGERTSRGLTSLAAPATIAAAAGGHARDMVANSYFSHQSQDGRTLLDRLQGAGYIPPRPNGWGAGEDIACATATLSTPRNIVADWMNSPPHRAEILEPSFRDIGVGVAPGTPPQCSASSDGGTYVADFGAPPTAPAPAAPSPSAATMPRQAISSLKVVCRRVRARGARAKGKRSARHTRLVCKTRR